LKGNVSDADGKPLAGANVIIKESFLGTVSNLSGEFVFKKEYTLISPYFPSPALPGSGSKGIISARNIKAPP